MGLLLALRCGAGVAEAPAPPPKLQILGPALTTAGQPSADWLGRLKAEGHVAVVHLSPPAVTAAVADEAQIVAAQGLGRIRLPVRWEPPDRAAVERVWAPTPPWRTLLTAELKRHGIAFEPL